jgi:TPR repeat protein
MALMNRASGLRRSVIALALTCFAPFAHGSFDDAMAQYAAKDYAHALAEFRRLAEIGDHASQFNIGVMYFRGEGVAKDPVQAYAWMALAAQADAKNWRSLRDKVYGAMSDQQRTQADSARRDLFADLSDEALANQLAPVLAVSDGNFQHARVKKRVRPKYPLLMQSQHKSGSVEVIFAVAEGGSTRLHGIVWATDTEFALAAVEALKQFRFEPGHLNGKAVEEYGLKQQFNFMIDGAQFNQEAISRRISDMHDKAVKGGPDDAYRFASTLEVLSSFTTIPKETGSANQWYWKAAALGNPSAQFSLGNRMLYGNACSADEVKGIKWLQRAAEAGQAEAQYVLAIDMLSGARLEQDRAAAIKWLERAADHGFSAARLKLAWLYATAADERLRNPGAAQRQLKGISEKIIDQFTLNEVRAAVAAASGNFRDAVRYQGDAIDEARRYELPVELPMARLEAYRSGKVWMQTL